MKPDLTDVEIYQVINGTKAVLSYDTFKTLLDLKKIESTVQFKLWFGVVKLPEVLTHGVIVYYEHNRNQVTLYSKT